MCQTSDGISRAVVGRLVTKQYILVPGLNRWEGNSLGEVWQLWPTGCISELCLHVLPSQGHP